MDHNHTITNKYIGKKKKKNRTKEKVVHIRFKKLIR